MTISSNHSRPPPAQNNQEVSSAQPNPQGKEPPPEASHSSTTFNSHNTEVSIFRDVLDSKFVFQRESLCGVIGHSTKPDLVALSETIGVPLFIYSGNGEDLSSRGLFTAQFHLLNKFIARHMIDHLKTTHQLEYLGILNDGDRNEEQITTHLQEWATKSNITTEMVNLNDVTLEYYRKGLHQLRDNGFRAIISYVNDPENLDIFIQAADQLHMNNQDFLFIFPQLSLRLFRHPLTDAQKQFLHGTIFIASIGGCLANGDTDPFWQAWHTVDDDQIKHWNQVSPHPLPDHLRDFRTRSPSSGSGLVYDTVMAFGIAACRLQNALQTQNVTLARPDLQPPPPPRHRPPPGGRPPPEGGHPPPGGHPPLPIPNGVTLATYVADLEFRGASGRVVMSSTKVRQPQGVSVGVINPQLDEHGELRQVLARKTYGTGSWVELEDIVYKGGIGRPPSFDLVVSNHNYLSTWVRVVGLVLYSIVVILSILFLVAITVVYRHHYNQVSTDTDAGIDTDAQPCNSVVLCVSCFVMAQSLLVLSLDEQVVNDAIILNRGCIVTPWLLSIGLLVTYSTLFFKLWRLERWLPYQQMTHAKPRQCWKYLRQIWPLILLWIATIGILLAWTITDPWRWQRKFVSMTPPETYGQCESEGFLAWASPLAIIMTCSVVLVFGAAWKTTSSSAPGEGWSNKATVFYTICVQLQAWFVFLPIAAVLDGSSSVDATYLGRALWIWILTASPLILVVGPRVIGAVRVRQETPPVKQRVLQSSGGIYISDSVRSSIIIVAETEKARLRAELLALTNEDD